MALVEGSPLRLRPSGVQAFGEHDIEVPGYPAVDMLERTGTPRPFQPADGTGVSDHLPLSFALELA